MYGPDRDFGYVCTDFDLGDMILGQGHDTLLGHGHHLRQYLVLSRWDTCIAVRIYGPDTMFCFVGSVTLTMEVLPWVMDITCEKYCPDQTNVLKKFKSFPSLKADVYTRFS